MKKLLKHALESLFIIVFTWSFMYVMYLAYVNHN